jgi:DNA-binding PadR family transcriptional regulator
MFELTSHQMLVLIAVARLGDAAYGVTVQGEVETCCDRSVSIPAVYAALDRLERLGLVRRRLSETRPERGGRARRYYTVTTAGQRRLDVERAGVLRMWRGVPHGGGGRR